METEPDIRIRPASEQDIERVINIEKLSFNIPWTIDFFKHELYNPVSFFYIMEIQNKLAAYVIFWIFKDESHIANVAVHPGFRKRGYGERLVNWVFDFCRRKGTKMITLEVNEMNTAARNLYRKMGFKIVGKRARYYENKYDALILTRELK